MTSATEKITSRRSGMGLEDALKSNVPLLYDNFVHADLEWPCNACAWYAIVVICGSSGLVYFRFVKSYTIACS